MRQALPGARRVALRPLLMLGAATLPAAVMAPAAYAQDYTNVDASGRVTAQGGAPVANATVTITSSDRGVTRTARTNESGAYTFQQLAPGAYDFSVSAAGFSAYQERRVPLSRQGSANSFTLVAADAAGEAAAGEITVVGKRQRTTDFEDSTTGAVIDVAELDKRVPVARSLQDVALLSPGVIRGSSAANGAFADQLVISGASFTENAFFVNGLNITNFRIGLNPVEVPYDLYQSIEVKTGGYPAEFGRATGGAINAVTKSGSNQFHASVLGTMEPDSLRASSPGTVELDNKEASSTRRELVFQGSGPVIKDHLFVYGLYTLRDFKSFTPDSDQNNATRVSNTSPFWAVKVDGYLTDDHHLEFTYFDSSNDTRRRSLEYDRETREEGAVTGGTNQRSGGINYVARYTGTFSPWLTVSAAYGRNKLRDGNLPLDTTNERVIDYRESAAGIDIGLNKITDAAGFTNDDRKFYRADIDSNFTLMGSHHVRVGYDREDDTSNQTFATIGDGWYKIFRANAESAARLGIAAGTDYYTTRVYSNSGSTTVRNDAFYLEDDWALFKDRLRLQLGIRNDRFRNQGVDGSSYYKSGDQWAPRIGASFDVFGDGQTKAYGFFGKYYLPTPGDLNLNVAGGTITYTRYNLFNGINAADGTPVEGQAIAGRPGFAACLDTGVNNCEVTADGTPASAEGAVAANLKPQSSREFILGAQHQFDDRIRVGAYFTHRELGNVLEDVSVDFGARAFCQGQGFSAEACVTAYPGGSNFVIANPGRDITVKINPLPDGSTPTATLRAEDLGYNKPKRNYNALTLTMDRTFDGTWSLNGSYTLAYNKGNYEGGVRSENGQLAVNRTADFDSPGFQNGAYGYLPTDRRHTMKLYGSYRPFSFLDLGFNGVVQSPQHYSCIGTVPESVDPYANSYHGYSYYCNGNLVPRGTAFNGDWLYQMDVSAVVRLPLPRNIDASLRFDVFNLFNSDSVTAYNEFGQLSDDSPNPNYRQPVNYQAPRYVRLQLRVGF